MKQSFFKLSLCLVLSVMSFIHVWAEGPEMNKVYTVPMEITANNSYLIPGNAFLSDATSAIITVSNSSWVTFTVGYYGQTRLADAPYGSSSFSFECTGDNLTIALNGNLYVSLEGKSTVTVTVLNKDANYVEPGTGDGGSTDDPTYTPDYTNQLDSDNDGKLEPCSEYPAFGAKVDYNKYPQKTNLPTIYIKSATEVDFTNKTSEYYDATIVVVDKHGNMKQRNEAVTFRGRGNSTWRSSKKKPWRLKFPEKTKFLAETDADFNEINNNANAKSWTLLANDFDKSLIRNALTHELVDYINGVNNANNLPFNPAYRFVDLVLNDEYLGTYQVSDQVQVDKNRVNIDADGWFVEYTINNNGFVEEPFIKVGSSYVNIKNPEDETAVDGDPNSTAAVNDNQQTTNTIYTEMKKTLNDLHTAITNKSGWRQYVDMASLVDWVIAMDITGNYDGGIANDYVYKSSTESKLHFGPLWDLDLGYGNYDDTMTTGKHFWNGNGHEWSGIAGTMNNIYSDPYFVKALYERWKDIYNKGALTDYMLDKVDYLKELIKESRELNYSEAGHKESEWWTNKWSLNENGLSAKTYSNYDDAITTITSFITNHTEWLDTEYHNLYITLGCEGLDPCGEGHIYDTYLAQADGSYKKGCSTCNTALDPTDSQTYYHFTIYPESKKATTQYATSWQPDKNKPNSIAVVEAKQDVVEGIEGWNIIAGKKNDDGNLTCKDFRLTDGHPYYGDNKFVATTATYTRTITAGNIGTICLPYKMQNAKNADAKFYHLKSISSDEMVLTPIQPEVEGNASAYVPVVFFPEADKTSLTVAGENITVKKTSALEPYIYSTAVGSNSEAVGWSIVGTMTKQVIDDVTTLKDEAEQQQYLYYFSGGKLYRATGKYTSNPFRAYFLSDINIFAASNAAASMRICIEDESATSILSTYGKPSNDAIHLSRIYLPLPEGEYIINGKRVIITK